MRSKALEVLNQLAVITMVVPKPIRGRTRKTVKIRGMQISGTRRSRKVFWDAFESSRGLDVIGM